MNSESCWGGSEYLFEVKRSHNFQYQFTHKKSQEVVGRFNATLERKYSFESHTFEGIGLTSKKLKMFYPHLIKDQGSSYYIHVSMQPNKPLPQHLSHLYDVNIKSWPSNYQVGSYIYPYNLTFEYFRETPKMKKPTTISSLDMNHQCVGLSHLEMYPGGGGLRCTQYKYCANDDFTNFPREELKDYHRSRSRKSCILFEDEPRFDEASWLDKSQSHVFDYEAFIPKFRDGLCGPIISYWARVNNHNTWFAAPKLPM